MNHRPSDAERMELDALVLPVAVHLVNLSPGWAALPAPERPDRYHRALAAILARLLDRLPPAGRRVVPAPSPNRRRA